jgi:uncharacterized protein (TIGR03067 family)
MEWGSGPGQEHRQRTATRRARLLAAEPFTDPLLRKAAGEFQPIAWLYQTSWVWRNAARMTQAEYDENMKNLREIPFKSDLETTAWIVGAFKEGLRKEAQIKEAGKVAFQARAAHSRLWRELLPLARRFAGPRGGRFPLRLGLMWARNMTGKPLTNLTIAIETNAAVELPETGRLHVVFFERFDPEDWESLPSWLVNKLWNGRDYVPRPNALRCSLWSDQVSFEDVVFDLNDLKPAGPPAGAPDAYRWGFFPAGTFAGTSDTTSPWTVPPLSAKRLGLTAGMWRGKDHASQEAVQLVIIELVGPNFTGINIADRGKSVRIVEGRIQDGRIEWEPVIANRGALGDPHWGTIRDGRMELSYGKDRTAAGTVSLQFYGKAPPSSQPPVVRGKPIEPRGKGPPAPAGAGKDRDLDWLQGVWVAVRAQADRRPLPPAVVGKIRWTITQDRAVLQTASGTEKQTLALEPRRTPKRIDVTSEEGPNKGKVTRGIYHLSRTQLIVAFGRPGTDMRPTSLAGRGGGEVLIVFRRPPGSTPPGQPAGARPPRGPR